MANNVHTLPVARKARRRGPVPALPRAEVLRIVDYNRRDLETPEQRMARVQQGIDDVGRGLLATIRAFNALLSELKT